METDWIEDFLAVADARSFSRAAVSRNSSQSAFSRRIQSLENWVGVPLIDRETNPPSLTPEGRAFRGFSSGIIRQLQQVRNVLRGEFDTPEQEVKFATAFTLSPTCIPEWFGQLHNKRGHDTTTRVSEMDVMEGATALISGEVDFLMCYHHHRIPVLLDTERYPHITLGRECIQPYSACDADGQPIYRLPGTPQAPLPLLSHTEDTFFVHVVDMLLSDSPTPCFLEHCHHSQMSEALKAMVVAGNGVGWLPEKCVQKELAEGRVAVAGGSEWLTPLEVRIYRSVENNSPMVRKLWDGMVKTSAP